MGVEKTDILTNNGAEICGPEFGNLPRKKLLISHICVSKCGHYGQIWKETYFMRNLLNVPIIEYWSIDGRVLVSCDMYGSFPLRLNY